MRYLKMLPLAAFVAAALVAPSAADAAVAPQLTLGWDHACALADDGSAKCWGYNSDGGLGTGDKNERTAPVPVTVASGFSQLVGFGDSSCAIVASGSVQCWGYNNYGELGNGEMGTDRPEPQTVIGVGGATKLFASGNSSSACAVVAGGTTKCWGANGSGQLGNPASGNQSTPVDMVGVINPVKVVFGDSHSCVLPGNGTVLCAGDDSSGALGLGPGDNSTSAETVVPGISNAVDVAVTEYGSCALLADGTVKCWGADGSGELGDGAPGPKAESPQTVPGSSGSVNITAGYKTNCATRADGTAICWGSNDDGQIGGGLTSGIAPVTQVSGLTDVVYVAGGQGYSAAICALRRGGAVACWGSDEYGDLGNGDPKSSSNVPVAVSGLDMVTLAYPGTGTGVTVPARAKVNRKKTTYSLTAALTTTPANLVAPLEACAGATAATVKYSYIKAKTVKKHGKKKHKKVRVKKKVTKRGVLVYDSTRCVSSFTLKLPVKYLNGKKITVTATAAGNGSLQPLSASTTYKLQKVKIKKKKRH